MKYLNKIINYGLWLLFFLLPWQTRLIYHEAVLKDAVWEYGRYSLYGTEIILIILIILGLIRKLIGHREASEARRGDSIIYAILVILIFSGLSVIWAGDKNLALSYWIRIIEGAGLFWLVYDFGSRANLKLALIGSGLVQGLLAIYQFITQSTFAFKWLGLPFISTWDLGASVVEFLDQRWLRAYGVLPHPNILGGFLAIVLLMIIINLWQLNAKIKAQDKIAGKDLYLNVFYWFSAGAVFLGLIFSFSRGAGLGFALGFLYLFIYALKNKLKIERWVSVKLGIFFVVLIGFILIGFPYQLFTARITAEGRLEQRSLIERKSALVEAQEMFKTRTLLGVGLGNYTKALQNTYPNYPGWAYQPVHNWYWLVLSELGLVGFLFFVFLLVNLWKKTGTVEKSLILTLLFISFFDHYFWDLFFGIMLWWLAWGTALKSSKE